MLQRPNLSTEQQTWRAVKLVQSRGLDTGPYFTLTIYLNTRIKDKFMGHFLITFVSISKRLLLLGAKPFLLQSSISALHIQS